MLPTLYVVSQFLTSGVSSFCAALDVSTIHTSFNLNDWYPVSPARYAKQSLNHVIFDLSNDAFFVPVENGINTSFHSPGTKSLPSARFKPFTFKFK